MQGYENDISKSLQGKKLLRSKHWHKELSTFMSDGLVLKLFKRILHSKELSRIANRACLHNTTLADAIAGKPFWAINSLP